MSHAPHQPDPTAGIPMSDVAGTVRPPLEINEVSLVECLDERWSLTDRYDIAHSVIRFLDQRRSAAGLPQESVPAATTPDELVEPRPVLSAGTADTMRASAADTMRCESPPGVFVNRGNVRRGKNAPDAVWSRLKVELRDFAEEDHERWGDVDESDLAQFLTGQCSAAERWRIQQTLRDHPAAAECVELVREVMAEQILVKNIAKPTHVRKRPLRTAAACVAVAAMLIAVFPRVMEQLGSPLNFAGRHLEVANSPPRTPESRLSLVETTLLSSHSDEPTKPTIASDPSSVRGLCIHLDASGCSPTGDGAGATKTIRLASGPLDPLDAIPQPTLEQLWQLVRPTTNSELQRIVAAKAISQRIDDPAALTPLEADALVQGRSAEAFAQFLLSHELPTNPLALDDVLKSLASDSPQERWAAVAALSQSWNPSCGASLVAVPRRDDFVPGTTQTLQPEPDPRITNAFPPRTARNESPTAQTRTAYKPVAELQYRADAPTTPVIVRRHVPVEVALNGPDDEPIRHSLPPTFAQPRSPTPVLTDEVPLANTTPYSPLESSGPTHPLSAEASRIVPSLIARLADSEDRLIRRTAIYVLAEFGPDAQPAVDRLLEIVEADSDPLSRRWAAYAIGRANVGQVSNLPLIDSLPRLVKQLDTEPDATVATALCYAISEVSRHLTDANARGNVETTLSRAMKQHASPQVRRWSAYALHSLNETPATQTRQVAKPIREPNSPPKHTSAPPQE